MGIEDSDEITKRQKAEAAFRAAAKASFSDDDIEIFAATMCDFLNGYYYDEEPDIIPFIVLKTLLNDLLRERPPTMATQLPQSN